MDWVRILAYVTGMVEQELLTRNEYLAAENRILKAQSKGRLQLSDAERATLGEIGHRLGRKALAEVANVARPDTILAWYRKLVAHKFDGSQAPRSPGRPRIKREVEQLIVRMAEENRDWGYDRIAGALVNLGYQVCDQTVGNVLQRHAVPPAAGRDGSPSQLRAGMQETGLSAWGGRIRTSAFRISRNCLERTCHMNRADHGAGLSAAPLRKRSDSMSIIRNAKFRCHAVGRELLGLGVGILPNRKVRDRRADRRPSSRASGIRGIR
jgi:Homeodomain-like domain